MSGEQCPFCSLAADRLIANNAAAIAFPDSYPVTEGHTLVVPRAHVASLFDLPESEQASIWKLVASVRAALAHDLGVTAFNIGVNDGIAAGQTVPHAHVHVIPRRPGDGPDPEGWRPLDHCRESEVLDGLMAAPTAESQIAFLKRITVEAHVTPCGIISARPSKSPTAQIVVRPARVSYLRQC